jgi:hypothetical protein
VTEAQAVQLLADTTHLIELAKALGMILGVMARWVYGCFWLLVCAVFLLALRKS